MAHSHKPVARAVVIRGSGGAEVLDLAEREVREPGPHEVLVAVAACGLNRADILQRRGFYPAPAGAPADIPGLEYAGTVAAVGPDVTTAAVGDRVIGIVGGGAMATYLVAHERELLPVPASLTLERAAAVPEVFMTAYDALVVQADMGIGARVLIHAIASGVGTAALQLARAAGARTIGTSRSGDKLERLATLDLSPDHPLQVEDGAFADAVAEHTGGADLILDSVGGAYMKENLRALCPRGCLVIIGLMGGATASVPLGLVLTKRARIIGTVLRSRPLEEKAALAQQFRKAVMPLLETGAVGPVIDDILPMADIAEAHRRMEQNRTLGKLVLRW